MTPRLETAFQSCVAGESHTTSLSRGLPLRGRITEPALRGPRLFGEEQAGGPTVTVNKTFQKL